MPDPLHWFRTWHTANPPPSPEEDEPGALVGVPEPPSWLDIPDWDEPDRDDEKRDD